jgi:hypothetical protein
MEKVTYNKTASILMGCLAIFLIYVGYAIDSNIPMVIGVLIVFLSIFYLINPAIKYDDEKMELKSPFGMTIGAYSFKKDKFKITEENLEINGKKLKVSPLMLDKTSYEELLIHIASKTKTS